MRRRGGAADCAREAVTVDFHSQLSELFREEDCARDMARKLMDAARHSKEAAAAEFGTFVEFLKGPMETHMDYEETYLFPKLEDRGLGPEVQVSMKQHQTVRDGVKRLEELGADHEQTAQEIFNLARLLLHHTNFEGDYIYPELTQDDWAELMEQTVA